jgi:hypothetical protein
MIFSAWAIRSGPRRTEVCTTRQTVNVGMTSSLLGSGWRKYSLRPPLRSGRYCPVKHKNPARPNHANFMACDYNIELFHKDVKQRLGFEEVATSGFDSVMSHVHWVYCAYILLHLSPPGVSAEVKSLGDTQRQLQQVLDNNEKRRVLQKLTQIGGVQRYTDELRQALAAA